MKEPTETIRKPSAGAGHSVRAQLEAAVAGYANTHLSNHRKSFEMYSRACAYLPGGMTRSTLFYRPFPLMIERGEGPFLWDVDGDRYLDLVGEFTAGVYGHDSALLRKVLTEIGRRGLMLSGPTGLEAELAQMICSRFPSCEQVRFCNSGTEANLIAIGIARAVSKRQKILVFSKGYHGGVLVFGVPEPTLNVPFPTVQAPYNDLEETRRVIRRESSDLAAIIIEPMLGSGGCIPALRDFLVMLREEATAHGILLIFDEVLTSRLAPGGLQQLHAVLPDLTTLGKYIGGGFSSGVVGGKRSVMQLLDDTRSDGARHYGTFNNNIASMVAGCIALRDHYTEESARRLNAQGERLRERMSALIRSRGLPMQITGMGSVMNVHFTDGQLLRPPAKEHFADAPLRSLMHLFMLSRGYYTALRGLVSLNLMIRQDHLDGFVSAFEEFLDLHGNLVHAAREADEEADDDE